jgi:transcriptional regulator GlxA family with amidase domain
VQPANRFALLPPAIEGCIAEAMLDDPYAQGIARGHAEVIALHLSRALGGGGRPAERRVRHELQTLWQKVDANLPRAWSVEQLAAELRVSEMQCHRWVGRYHRATPMGMVTRLRMQRAEELLRHTDYPLYLIADAVGYRTAFSFSRAFKRHTGASPKRCRAAVGAATLTAYRLNRAGSAP